MEINEIYYGFKLERVKDIKDIGSKLYEFKHLKSGATLVYLANDDDNKCFSFGFRTIPTDSTGVCHIIEHSVLCGSQKYPLKEPFVNLLKGSMSTFLNAMTACDFTIYPVASQNDKDFDNLVSVYMDACLAPLSVKDPKPFLQEGWHLELTDRDQLPCYKGVVYNEMKGAMSSVEAQLEQRTCESIYKGSTYEYNSGGDPSEIPNLTYEDYKRFYHKHYHPSNGLLYLYGKMNILAKLQFLNDNYLAFYDQDAEVIDIQKPEAKIDLEYTAKYAIPSDEEEKDNTYMSLSFALDDYHNQRDLKAFAILDVVLMGSNDSKLKKALLDAHLGEDIVTSVYDAALLPTYQVYLYKTNPELKERFYKTFIDSCRQIVKEGIDKKALLSTINNAEFKFKEMDTGRTPKGLLFAFDLMQAYNYHIDFAEILNMQDLFEFYKKELNNGYFEGLIEKYILNSKHYSLVTLLPDRQLEQENEAQMHALMTSIKAKMSDAELDECLKMNAELLAYQSASDTQEELKTLPKLSLKDLDDNVSTLPQEVKEVGNVKLIKHEFNTNGIAYLNLYFDLNVIEYEDLLYAKLLTQLLTSLDTKNYTLLEFQNFVRTYLGSLTFDIYTSGITKDKCVAKFVVSASSLKENISYLNKAITELLNNLILDGDKIKTLFIQLKSTVRNSIIENGNVVAMNEAKANSSKGGAIANKISGLSLYRFLEEHTENFDAGMVIAKIKAVMNKLFNKANMIASISGDEETVSLLEDSILSLAIKEETPQFSLHIPEDGKGDMALIIPSGVSYNALATNLKDLGENFSGKLNIVSHILNYDYLWPEVRVKGGAYGCRLGLNSAGDIAFSSYRDPNVKNTYEAYSGASNYLEHLEITEDEFLTYLIGAVGSYDQPVSNALKISNADGYYLRGISDDERKKIKQEMLDTTLDDVKGYAKLFKKLSQMGNIFSVGNETKIKEFKHFKGTINL